MKKKIPRGYPKGKWSSQAVRVMEERYLIKDIRGRILETPDEMCWRVAKEIGGVEKKFGTDEKKIKEIIRSFYELMVNRLFLPNSPTLMNAGRRNNLQYSACFVLPVEDSLSGIFEAVKRAALIHQSGGGTGFSFSRLRPKGSIVRSTRGVASGPVSFMRVFDAATAEIKQGGMRRGANMGVLRVDHPDILEFIESKKEGGITNFNISVAATDEFMKAVKRDGFYRFYDPLLKKKTKKVKAREVFEKICQMAWATGDPGMIFIDKVNAGPANPVPEMGPIEATNPCGEQPLYPNEACNLGSINLSLMVKGKKKKGVDWKRLEEIVHLAVRFLDNVIEINPFPLEEITKTVLLNRRIGLGVMGWADMLFQLEIPYESKEAVKLGEKIMKFIQREGYKASQQLAKERGPFPNFSKSIYKNGSPLRNATVTTIAPTGSLSILANCSSGIEPLFALSYRHKTSQRELAFVNPYFLQAAKKHRLSPDVVKKVEEEGRLANTDAPLKLKKIFATAHEVSWRGHVNMQAAFQKGTDNAVSKTINFPHEATLKDVKNAYLYAYRKGCVGITVYRDRCKEEQVLYVGKQEEEKLEIKPRPMVVSGKTYRVKTPVGTAFITINANGDENPLEVFITVGKAGSDVRADSEAIGRLISLCLRLGSNFSPKEVLAQIVDQLEGIGGSSSIGFGKERVRSLADGIAKVLKLYLGEKKEASLASEQPSLPLASKSRDICPKCGQATLIYEEGCLKCASCGYSKC